MAATSTSPSPFGNRIYNISFTQCSSISIPANFPQRPSSKSLILCLKPQPCTPSSLLVSHVRVGLGCFPSDGVEVAQASTQSKNPELEARPEQPEQENEEQQPVSDAIEARRLYVGNLPFSFTKDELTKLFAEAGTVESAEIVYARLTDRSRGFGFVTMASVDDAQNAIRMFDGSQVGGRTARVNFPEVPRGKEISVQGPRPLNTNTSNSGNFIDSPYKVYAGNLGWRVTSQDLRDAFDDLPGVLSAKVVYERGSRRSRGFGFVAFENAEAVEAAIQAKNGMELQGRPLRLSVAADKPAFQFQTPSGEDTENSFSGSDEFVSRNST